MQATSLIETVFSMLILAICITMASLLFFALTSYEDRIENIVSQQENLKGYKVKWELKK